MHLVLPNVTGKTRKSSRLGLSRELDCAKSSDDSSSAKTKMVFSVAYFTHRLISLRRSLLLLDHFVRLRQHVGRNSQADLLRRLQIDHQLELRRLLHRKVGWLGAF